MAGAVVAALMSACCLAPFAPWPPARAAHASARHPIGRVADRWGAAAMLLGIASVALFALAAQRIGRLVSA